MLTVKQAAERAGVSRGLVYSWIAVHVPPIYGIGRGGLRVSEEQLAAFLKETEQSASPLTATARDVVTRPAGKDADPRLALIAR